MDTGGPPLTEDDLDLYINLSPYLNPHPYEVALTASLHRSFQLFRTMGLRHLLVVDSNRTLQGIITRKDLLPSAISASATRRGYAFDRILAHAHAANENRADSRTYGSFVPAAAAPVPAPTAAQPVQPPGVMVPAPAIVGQPAFMLDQSSSGSDSDGDAFVDLGAGLNETGRYEQQVLLAVAALKQRGYDPTSLAQLIGLTRLEGSDGSEGAPKTAVYSLRSPSSSPDEEAQQGPKPRHGENEAAL
eukprot:c18284_g1_i4.p1 GENE.c18284_g1_i4~~c18284_g1_i4.p1  ORF type:complete len:246 (+),score=49.58 c18284_g1_i4:260-997(+)